MNEVTHAFFLFSSFIISRHRRTQFEIHDKVLRNQELAKDKGAQIKGAIKHRCSSGRHNLGFLLGLISSEARSRTINVLTLLSNIIQNSLNAHFVLFQEYLIVSFPKKDIIA